ncbi:putative quinol monooxygenase [Qaidamihabitans albus]|uniref:putative quinol monooxygenase n=1 Tax=Qaidamihabitans albus TaxID=2795733 RepID=UPI0018F1876E|nr:antibiotic biosynthesis monooxygenase family protein [Qaidamihabitans albus]
MFIVSGKLYVDEDARDAYVGACRSVLDQARAAPGCLDFVLAADPIEPDRINVYERWESDEHLERFRGSGPEPGQLDQIRHAEVAKYRIAATEPP